MFANVNQIILDFIVKRVNNSLKKKIENLVCFICIYICIELNGCSSLPCMNNAICNKRPMGKFQCDCLPGYDGTTCDQDVKVCHLGYCQNNAKCIEGLGLNYTCNCSIGYTGMNCSTVINECEIKKPCLNDAKCKNTQPGQYKCECQENFSGNNCEIGIFLNTNFTLINY